MKDCRPSTLINIMFDSLSSVLSYNSFDLKHVHGKNSDNSMLNHVSGGGKQFLYNCLCSLVLFMQEIILKSSIQSFSILIILRLTITTLMNSSNSKILNIDGEETSFSSNKIQILISLGWFFHFLAIVCNICFYLVHPSEAKFRLNQAKIHVFGKEKDLWYPLKFFFKHLKLCFTCACCCKNGEDNTNHRQEEQEIVHQNNTP